MKSRIALLLVTFGTSLQLSSAGHKDLYIECELQPGVPSSCCDALSDSVGGSTDYEWYELPGSTKGYFQPAMTVLQHTSFHCNVSSSGRASLYNLIDGGVLEGHGVSIGSCGGMGW
jgi:hypothetical protein